MDKIDVLKLVRENQKKYKEYIKKMKELEEKYKHLNYHSLYKNYKEERLNTIPEGDYENFSLRRGTNVNEEENFSIKSINSGSILQSSYNNLNKRDNHLNNEIKENSVEEENNNIKNYSKKSNDNDNFSKNQHYNIYNLLPSYINQQVNKQKEIANFNDLPKHVTNNINGMNNEPNYIHNIKEEKQQHQADELYDSGSKNIKNYPQKNYNFEESESNEVKNYKNELKDIVEKEDGNENRDDYQGNEISNNIDRKPLIVKRKLNSAKELRGSSNNSEDEVEMLMDYKREDKNNKNMKNSPIRKVTPKFNNNYKNSSNLARSNSTLKSIRNNIPVRDQKYRNSSISNNSFENIHANSFNEKNERFSNAYSTKIKMKTIQSIKIKKSSLFQSNILTRKKYNGRSDRVALYHLHKSYWEKKPYLNKSVLIKEEKIQRIEDRSTKIKLKKIRNITKPIPHYTKM